MTALSLPDAHRPEIHGLRAVAVTMVVAYHVGLPGASAGFVGVDVFFAISGYLITAKLLREPALPLSAALAAFYAQRARRILPALAVVLLAVMIVGEALLLPTGEQQGLGKSGLAAAMFVANLFFWRRGDDYFADPTAVQPLLHTWSLSVEEQLYLVWPLLLLVLGSSAAPRTSPRHRLVGTVAAVTGLSFGLSLWLSHGDAVAAFFFTPARAWELGSGGLLAITLDRGRQSRPAGALGVCGLLLIVSTGALHELHLDSLPLLASVAVVGTLLVIAGGSLAPRAAVNRLLALRVVGLTGSVSYAWYLWHWPLIAFGRLFGLGERSLLRDSLLALVAYGIACLSTKYVEMPIRNGAVTWLQRPRATLIWASVCSISMAGLCLGVWQRAERERRASLAPASLDCLDLALDEGDAASPCRLAVGQHANVFLLGDSHANHWSPVVSALATEANVSAFERSRNNCPVPLPALATNGRFRGAFARFPDECIAFSRSVLREAENTARSGLPTGVILSAHWNTYVPSDESDSSGIEDALSSVIDALDAAGIRVLVVGPTPEFELDPPACVARRNDASCLLARRRFDGLSLPVTRMLERVNAGQPGARYWPPAALYCDEDDCRPTRNGRLTFRDYGHLSRFGAELAREPLAESFRWLSSGPRAAINAATPAE